MNNHNEVKWTWEEFIQVVNEGIWAPRANEMQTQTHTLLKA